MVSIRASPMMFSSILLNSLWEIVPNEILTSLLHIALASHVSSPSILKKRNFKIRWNLKSWNKSQKSSFSRWRSYEILWNEEIMRLRDSCQISCACVFPLEHVGSFLGYFCYSYLSEASKAWQAVDLWLRNTTEELVTQNKWEWYKRSQEETLVLGLCLGRDEFFANKWNGLLI